MQKIACARRYRSGTCAPLILICFAFGTSYRTTRRQHHQCVVKLALGNIHCARTSKLGVMSGKPLHCISECPHLPARRHSNPITNQMHGHYISRTCSCMCVLVHTRSNGVELVVGVSWVGLGWGCLELYPVRLALNRSTKKHKPSHKTHRRFAAHLSHPHPISAKGPPFSRSLGPVPCSIPEPGVSHRHVHPH